MGGHWHRMGYLIAILASCCFCATSWVDTVGSRKHIKADTATATIKSVTLSSAPTAASYSADSVLVIDGGVIKKRYTPPTIASLTNTMTTNYAGQTVTGLTVNWSLTGAPITSQTLTDASPALSDRTKVFTGLILTTDKVYTLAITDGVNPTSSTTTVYFLIQKYYGSTAYASPNESQIESGSSVWLAQASANRALSSASISGGGGYINYAYPASWGDVQLYVNGFATTWNKTTVSITNAYGDVRNYYVYTSPNAIVGTITLSATGI